MSDQAGRTAIDAFRRFWFVIVATTAAGLIGGAGLALTSPRIYEAQAVLYVDPSGQPNAFQQSDGLLSRYLVEQATSPRVLDRAQKKLEAADIKASDTTVRATALRGTNTIGVTAQARAPQVAADMANAVADALTQQQREDAEARSQSSITYLSGELERLSQSMADETRDTVLTALHAQYLTTYTNLQNMRLVRTREMDAVSVLQPARVPSRSSNTSLQSYVLVGLLSGLIVGTLAALLLTRLDDRVREADELRDATGVPVVIPVGSLSTATNGDNRQARYDSAMFELMAQHPKARTIMLAAASARDSAAEVALQLGFAAERSGLRVIVLANGADHSDEMIRSMDNDQYDMRLVAVPPPTTLSASALSLARKADASAVVATRLRTRTGDVRRQVDELRAAGGTLAATFLLVD